MLDGVYGTFMVSEEEKQECVCGSYFTTDNMNWLANIVIPDEVSKGELAATPQPQTVAIRMIRMIIMILMWNPEWTYRCKDCNPVIARKNSPVDRH